MPPLTSLISDETLRQLGLQPNGDVESEHDGSAENQQGREQLSQRYYERTRKATAFVDLVRRLTCIAMARLESVDRVRELMFSETEVCADPARFATMEATGLIPVTRGRTWLPEASGAIAATGLQLSMRSSMPLTANRQSIENTSRMSMSCQDPTIRICSSLTVFATQTLPNR